MDVPRENGLRPAPAVADRAPASECPIDLRDPWGEKPGGPDGEGADPGEVTVQLDPLKQGRPDGTDAAGDVPVFVDESGRRSRTFRRIGIFVGIACGAYAVVIVAALLSGNAGAPWLPVPVPGQADDKPAAGEVDSSSAPDDSASPGPGAPDSVRPGGTGATASGSAAAPGRPGASKGPGASGSAAPTGAASAAVRPSASGAVRPTAGPTATGSPASGPSGPVIAPPASTPPPPASTPAESPSPVSSASPAGGASTTVAGGPAEPATSPPAA
ncbi:hypothetical protein QFZ56_003141 [Streptomyces achromogenes]|uniref:Translation initiation factor IF-2 n=1 Tax=Streptomyces achromogenes TaxID=67255 RepID=A0ABU0Q315_STRAH|nr:hypothetical protein [Streptomyces achromogenes]MDQ0684178.1 hypothetical protein [Streptomyces achromogenes]